MAEFVSLEDSEESQIVIPTIENLSVVEEPEEVPVMIYPAIGEIIEEQMVLTKDLQPLEIPDDSEEHICVKDNYDLTIPYGNPTEKGAFRVINLFSELTTEFLRAKARLNLGIADEYSLTWGNINGNLLNQKDLYNFVTSLITLMLTSLTTNISESLNTLENEVDDKLDLKANINSPTLTGTPKASTPESDDNSNRIATTEWVLLRIEAASLTKYITNVKCEPSYMYADDLPKTIIISWEYTRDIDSQMFNEEDIDKSVRSRVVSDVNELTSFIILYSVLGSLGSETVIFHKYNAIYYGVSNNYKNCSKTIDKSFTVTAGEGQYIYIMIPLISTYDFSVNGFTGGFLLESTSIINSVTYYIYRSLNPNLGKTTINIIE